MAEERHGGERPAPVPASADEPLAPDQEVLDVPEAAEPRRRLLLVSLPAVVVALPADSVVEVLPSRACARIPGAPRSVAGVMNRRGRMLTVVDLGVVLGGEGASIAVDHRVVVVSYRGREIGLAVRDVLQFASDWWTETGGHGDEPRPSDDAAETVPPASAESDADEQLHVIDVETVLAPLFGGGVDGVGEPTEGRS